MQHLKRLQKTRHLAKWLKNVQNHTGRTVVLQTSPSALVHETAVMIQASSPFYTRLPAEVRLIIYEFALAQYCDRWQPYKRTASYYRPGYSAPHKTDTAMLLTCRFAWLEAHHLTLKLATHTFWFFDGPRDEHRLRASILSGSSKMATEAERYRSFFESLTTLNKLQPIRLQIFASHAWLQALTDVKIMQQYFSRAFFQAREITITIRDASWSQWKFMSGSDIEVDGLRCLLKAPTIRQVQQIKLELEMSANEWPKLKEAAMAFSNIQGIYHELQEHMEVSRWAKTWPKSNENRRHTRKEFWLITLRWCARERDDGPGTQACLPCLTQSQLSPHSHRRGGRRSQAVSRLRRRPVPFGSLSQVDSEITKSDDLTDCLLDRWEKKGSLLTLL